MLKKRDLWRLVKGIQIFFHEIRGDFFRNLEIDYKQLPTNRTYKMKVGRKKNDELKEVKDLVLKEAGVGISRITGKSEIMIDEGDQSFGWEEIDPLTFVRGSDLTKEEEEELLKSGFKEIHFRAARKIKFEWAKGNGRKKVKEALPNVQYVSDGNVGRMIACFNRCARRKKELGLKSEIPMP